MQRTRASFIRRIAVTATILAAPLVVVGAGHAQAATCTVAGSTAVGIATIPTANGYWVAAANGNVCAFGSAADKGSLVSLGIKPVSPIVAIASTPTGLGYWLAASDGGVFSFGDAQFYGSMGGTPINKPIIGMGATKTGKGYWLAASDGGVFSFGDAQFFGSLGSSSLVSPIVDFLPNPANTGYYMLSAEGGIYGFGKATYRGGRDPKSQLVLGATPFTSINQVSDGSGYRLVDADGLTYGFPSGTPQGVTGNNDLVVFSANTPIVDTIGNPTAGAAKPGWYALAADGGVFAIGLPFYGSAL